MPHTIAILAAGNMGAATAARITASGGTVLTCLDNRSKATRDRAEQAGMRNATLPDLAKADMFLSICPPSEAVAMASAMAPHLTAASLYVDCNAVSPQTILEIEKIIAPTGAGFVDGGIIGGPPTDGKPGPVYYFSGAAAPKAMALADYNLEVKDLNGPIAAASGLKMSYAGITKGTTAILSAMMLAASRFGAAAALHAELANSQKALLAWSEKQIPGMYSKAYRWVGEMEEIAGFLEADPAAAQMFHGAAALYDRLAKGADETSVLSAFLAHAKEK
jgi:3-hydroxyisobutyrate dehydrogenase-like beta-hydroxyacid dehydrogenase